MKSTTLRVAMLGVFLFFAPLAWAQTPAAANQSAASPAPAGAAAEVPRLIKFSGTLLDALDQPMAGPVGVTFALYKEQEKGAALWMETQNVTPDARGFYTVFLGANSAHGVPAELFASGEARWLEVQVERQAEQPRVLLVSVPYALKAADADTLGGKPLSAFVTTGQAAGGSGSASGKRSASAGVAVPAVSGTGSTNVVAKWLDNMGTLGNSTITDDGTNVSMTGNLGALAYKFTGNATPPTDPTATILNAANIGPVFSGLSFKVRTGLTAPADALSIDFNRNVSMTGNASALTYKFTGNAALPTDATATILNAANIGPVFSGFSFKVRTGSPPADALSVDPSQNVILSGNLNLSGAGKAIIFPNGTVMSSAATGVGGGTITGVTAGTGLTGGGTAGGVNLAINPTVVPQLGATSNTFTGSIAAASFTGVGAGLNSLALPNTTSGSVGVITLGGTPFLHNFGSNNTFVGASAGNTSASLTSANNTGVGSSALNANTTGNGNSAFGSFALSADTTGGSNAAFGYQALFTNTTGNDNSAFGTFALSSNTTGFSNSAFGSAALIHNTMGALNSAFGNAALPSNTTGNHNSAFAFNALNANTTGSDNSAFGLNALTKNTTGSSNAAFGANALGSLTSGGSNIAIGQNAGSNLTAAESNNIYIGNSGVGTESNTIRIGDPAVHTATFLAGTIMGNLSGNATTATTATNFTGSLGGEVTGTQGTTVVSNAVSPNSANAIVRRDASGSFSAGSVTLSGQLVSTVATGVAPLVVNSLSQVTNLNAQFLGGLPPAAFATLAGGNNFTGNQSITGNVSLTGNLALPATTNANTGVITLGGTPFLHNFGTNNTFLGASAGNTSASLTGGTNTGVGASALSSNTTGFNNSAFGASALQANTMGFSNDAFGGFALLANTTGQENDAFGALALEANTAGNDNDAFGRAALNANTMGINNSAFGADALQQNTIGNQNSGFGANALNANTTGSFNSAFGSAALQHDNPTMPGEGTNNAAFGTNALNANTTGSLNSAFGEGALDNLISGSVNIAIGPLAGENLKGGESENIYIGNPGMIGESNTIRIGDAFRTKTFITGIAGVNVSGTAVLVSTSGQLGVAVSSRRFKNQIADMGTESDLLMKLRPVTFYYKPELDSTRTRQYGLVAEEVAQVAPQLVVFDKDGAPQTVRYHFVNAMLLNEVQKQRQLVEEQRSTITRQQAEIQDLAARLAKLEALVSPAQ